MIENRKKLDGLSDAITKRYFSDKYFYKKGSMATWIWNLSAEKDIDELSIDILRNKVEPKELEITPILFHLPRIKTAIIKTQKNENYNLNYIQEAKIYIKVYQDDPHIKCTTILTNNEGEKYIGTKLSYTIYDNNYKHFNLRANNNNMDWASEGENQLNTSEWFGALLRYFAHFGKRKFNSFYNQRELKKNAIIGNLFQITLFILFFYFLYKMYPQQ